MMRRVLIIEDEADLARLIKRHLEDSGLAVETVSRGDAGLKAAKASTFDLILLDLMLPGMDGLEICRRLRADRIDTPIIMVTARTSEVDKVLGLDSGADDYIAKPFGPQELMDSVDKVFKQKAT